MVEGKVCRRSEPWHARSSGGLGVVPGSWLDCRQGMVTCLDQERRRACGAPPHGVPLRLDTPHQLLQLLAPLQRPQPCSNPSSPIGRAHATAEQVSRATEPRVSVEPVHTKPHVSSSDNA